MAGLLQEHQEEYGWSGSTRQPHPGSLTERPGHFPPAKSINTDAHDRDLQRAYATLTVEPSTGAELSANSNNFARHKRSVQAPPGQKLDMRRQHHNSPSQTYWQFKREGPAQGGHAKAASSDLGVQPRHAGSATGSLQAFRSDGGFQATERGPVAYQRAGGLASP